MSAVRSSILRASRAAARSNPSVVARIAYRPISTTTTDKQREVISEKNIPVASYTDSNKAGEPQRTSIPVRPNPDIETKADEAEPNGPITKALFNKLPKNLQKMTVMDKVILITGGARGLGNSIAEACAEAGAKAIVIFDANQQLGDESAAELHAKTGTPVQFYKVDVRDGGAIIEAVNAVVEQFGAPDVLINSAGIADSNIKAEEYDHSMFRRLIDINLTGSFLMSQAVGKAMMAAEKPGSIVLVASMSGTIVNYPQEQSCYNASKAGVIQLGKSLAAEWAKYSIRVNSISPGYMDTALNRVPALDAQKKIWTSLTPQQRLGAIDDLNGLAVYLASDSSAFMTGSDLLIDGGYHCW
jgi:NAD(P)-dependent dehydrogenase (short-subunit alcohol dehydrogenase family)